MRDFLVYAASKYYEGNPVITDAEFDRLAKQHDFTDVGARVDTTRAIKHAYRMYSLQKCFVGEPVIKLTGPVVETPKLDGAAIALVYVDGNYVRALTRGDGKAGLDITSKVRHLVPQEIFRNGIVQITGEIVAPKTIPNARNYAAGALNLKDDYEILKRDLTFVAYGIQPYQTKYWEEDMELLLNWGFRTVAFYQEYLTNTFPTDGIVYRVNNNEEFEKLGYTDKHPRGAFALKKQQEGVITVLQDVIWQVGRTGVVSPVAVLEPVLVGDATVSRATLHNMKYIEDLGLELGCEVEIIRSGEIIPRVVRRV